MMRIAVLVLVAANLLYFGWSRWVDQGAPDLTAVAATTTARKPAPTPPAPPPGPPPCATVGPFTTDLDATAAEQQLAAAGWGLMKRQVTEQQREGWWVYVASDSAAAQARTLNTLRSAGLRDAFALPDDPEHKVSVGIFSEENRAEDRASRVQRLRLDAVVKERTSEQTVTWIDIPGVARETLADGRLAQTGLQLERLRIEACPAPAPQGAAAAAQAPEAAAAPAATPH